MSSAVRCVALVLACALGACAGSALQRPTNHDVERILPEWPTSTLSNLEAGRNLYQSRCSRCHQLYEPDRHTPDGWRMHVANMSERAGLTDTQEDQITQYLIAIAGRTQDPAASGTDH